MSLLQAFDDDFADILGSDNEVSGNEESSRNDSKSKPQSVVVRQKIESQHILKAEDILNADDAYDTNKKDKDKNSKSEKKLAIHKIDKPKRKKKMLHSQSNASLKSTTNDLSAPTPISMSKEEALSLLHSESMKGLNKNKSNNESIAKQNNSDEESDSDNFDFVEHPNKNINTNKSNNSSDNESNDSILDWLDEPRVKTTNNIKPLLPQNDTKPVNHENESNTIEQWQEWLGLSTDKEEDNEFMYLAEKAAKSTLPTEWEKVNDSLYRNIRTDEKTMTHPLLKSVRNELESLRNKRKQEKQTQIENVNDNNNNNAKPKPVSLRQISTTEINYSSTKPANISNIPKPIQIISETVMNNNNNNNNNNICEYCSNLRMELSETRNKLKKVMTDKSNLYCEIDEMNNKTEIMLSEQKQLLSETYKMEIAEFENENKELKNLNYKLQNKYETELINLERNYKQNDIKLKEEKFADLTLIEQRSRNELFHQMELHRNTIKELKKQHENEIESLNNIHQKQLQNLRQLNNNCTNLDFLIQKMETSTINLNKLQKDIEFERDDKQKQIIIKENELIRDKKSYSQLLEKFKILIEETKIEKIRIREIENNLKIKENQILSDLTKNNHKMNIQIEKLNDEKTKFEINKNRWEKEKQFEINDIQRIKTEHNQTIKLFYEECEIQRIQMNKQKQILNENNMKYIKLKRDLKIEGENLQSSNLKFEEKLNEFEIENNQFKRKVININLLSEKVYNQSENIKNMYNEAKNIQQENNILSMQLISKEKELNIIKQQMLIEQKQIKNERTNLEKEQLNILLKNQPLQPINNNNNNNNNNIDSELKQLKKFVNECNQNILNYKADLNDLKNKRKMKTKKNIINKINHNRNNNNTHFNPSIMSFPSYHHHNKSSNSNSSFISNSLQHSHTRSSLKSVNNNNQPPHLNVSNNTNSTLQSTFVSMANIDTPITIDNKNNKTKKHNNNNLCNLNDSNIPLTPKQIIMPNLSKIQVTEQDNHDDDDDDDFNVSNICNINQIVIDEHGNDENQNQNHENDYDEKTS